MSVESRLDISVEDKTSLRLMNVLSQLWAPEVSRHINAFLGMSRHL